MKNDATEIKYHILYEREEERKREKEKSVQACEQASMEQDTI